MRYLFLSVFFFANMGCAQASVKVGDKAPLFETKNQSGETFRLADRAGKGWTVLFFYPKAGTPGCTKQACAFRDSIKVIRNQGAEVYGVSSDSVEAQAKFHKEHHLSFPLLADPDLQIINKYGVKMLAVSLAKRWTFLIDPNLVVRDVNDDVDPVMDAKRVGEKLAELQKGKS
jgi:thioredoxin-dependent peroxiredoxin